MKPENIVVKIETAYESKDSMSLRLTPNTLAQIFIDMTADEKEEFFKITYGTMKTMYPDRYVKAIAALHVLNKLGKNDEEI